MTAAERHQLLRGFAKTLPLVIGVVPFGLAYGVVSIQAGLTLAETMLMSLVVFAGASQFMAVGMFASAAGGPAIVLSTLLINLRHLVMGLSISPYLSKATPRWQRLLAFGLTDEAYLVSITHYREQNVVDGSPHFLLGSGLAVYVFWNAASFAGAVFGGAISDPLSWGLDFMMPVTFFTMLLPQLVSRRLLAVASVGAVTATATYLLVPGTWYIVAATVAATLTGIALETRAGAAGEAA